MSDEKPTISVIIPTYDRANLVGRSIQSVLNQTYRDLELIIVDDASKDNTEDVIKSFNDERIKYIRHEKNKGGSAARNTGINLAKGGFLAFLDSDDEWFPEKLEKQMNVFQNALSNVGVVYTGYYWIGNNVKTYTPPDRIIQKDGNIQEALLKENFITTSAALVKKECFEKLGSFDEKFPALQDWELFIRFSKYYCFRCIDEPLVRLYYQSTSISSDHKARTRALELIIEKHFEDLKKYKPTLATHYVSIGRQWYYNGNKYKGIKYYLKAIKTNPISMGLLLSIIITLFGRNVHVKAVESYQKVFK
ncbi:MAG: glycosyltransferase [Candidatus Methanoperedens sp.]|nr:glycosyltransferase [Candidatus Methanoperedens sp.]